MNKYPGQWLQFNTCWWTVSTPAHCTVWAQYSFCRFLLLHPSWSLVLLEAQHTNTIKTFILLFLCHTLLFLEFTSKIAKVLDLWPEQQSSQSYEVGWKPFSIHTNSLCLCSNYSDFSCGVQAGDHSFLLGSFCHHFSPRWISTCVLLPQESMSKCVCVLLSFMAQAHISCTKFIFFLPFQVLLSQNKTQISHLIVLNFSHPNILSCLIVVDISGKGHYRDRSRGNTAVVSGMVVKGF